MAQDLIKALALLDECARQLQRTGGMLNKDLARDVARIVSQTRAGDATKAVEA